MAIFQLDLTVKTAIELGMEDMRKNPWLIDDILSDCVENIYLKDKYGQKQIDACKEWFMNNQVDIYMRPRNDKDRIPCITITPGNSPEKEEMKHMADLSTETVTLLPNKIGKPIPYVVKPFTPTGYDDVTGEVGIDPNVKGLNKVSEGMILVDPATGNGYIITEILPNGVRIEAGLEIAATQLGILPQFQFYVARREHTFFQDNCTIGCHAHGDPQVAIWLHSIVLYSILRYRESLLEANGFTQSSLISSSLYENPNYSGANGEQAFSRDISLTGMVENSWIKSPRRIIESVALQDKSFFGGIRILSNLDSPDFIDKENETWYTDAENENDPDDPEDQDEE